MARGRKPLTLTDSTGNVTLRSDLGSNFAGYNSGESASGNDSDFSGSSASGGTDSESDTGSDSESDTGTGDSFFTSPGEAFGIDTGTDSADSDTGNPVKKRRGRPPGSGRKAGKPSKKTVSSSLEGIEGILLSLHLMGAAFLKIPELQLADEEAAKLSEAIGRVAALYDFGASEKTLAWINLAVCMGGVYGTRIFAYNLRIKSEAEKKRKQNLTPFPMENPNVNPFAQNATT